MVDFNPADYPQTCSGRPNSCGAPAYTGGGKDCYCTNPDCVYFDKDKLTVTEAEKVEAADPNVKKADDNQTPPTINIPQDSVEAYKPGDGTDSPDRLIFKVKGETDPEKRKKLVELWKKELGKVAALQSMGAPQNPRHGDTWFNDCDGHLYRYIERDGWKEAPNAEVAGTEKHLEIRISCNAEGLQKALEEAERLCHKKCQKDTIKGIADAIWDEEIADHSKFLEECHDQIARQMMIPKTILDPDNQEAECCVCGKRSDSCSSLYWEKNGIFCASHQGYKSGGWVTSQLRDGWACGCGPGRATFEVRCSKIDTCHKCRHYRPKDMHPCPYEHCASCTCNQPEFKDLVTVKPMDGPVGLHFYYDLIHGGKKPNKNGDVFPDVDYAEHEKRVMALAEKARREGRPIVTGQQGPKLGEFYDKGICGSVTGRITHNPDGTKKFSEVKAGLYLDGKMIAGERQTKNRPYDGGEPESTGR